MITSSPVIRQIAPPQPGMDFWALRQKGIERIIELGSGVWTDFNVHDPGITILEVLCYAINDLSYRANLPIQDLLAERSGRFALPGVPLAPEVLTCNPTTAHDWRKVLIDLEGVANAWVFKSEFGEVRFNIIKADEDKLVISTTPKTSQPNYMPLNGLLNVLIDLDRDALHAGCTRHDVLRNVENTLHRYRNLCEDIVNIAVVPEHPMGVCTQIELDGDALPEQVLAEVCYAIQQHLTPPVRFHGLEDMLERKGTRSLDAVFEGPLLANGFIDDAELTASDLRPKVFASDLYHIIRDVPGVKDVKGIKLKINEGWKEWEDELPVGTIAKLVLDFSKSQFRLTRYGAEVSYDPTEVAESWTLLDWTRRPTGAGESMAVTYPEATTRPDLGDYFTIQNDFPQAYHVGSEGLRDDASRLHHAQVKQLKAYLLFFDQILANYLVRLTEVKDVFRNDRAGALPTAGADLTDQIPFIDAVLGEGYAHFVQQGTDSPSTLLQRRHELVNHLLARFGESFADYALTLWYDDPDTTGTRQDFLTHQERTLAEKANWLQKAPLLNAQRGKAFDYRARRTDDEQHGAKSVPDIWNTDNVEGLKKKVCALLGMDDFSRHTLTCPPAYSLHFYAEAGRPKPTKGAAQSGKAPAAGQKQFYFDVKHSTGKTLLNAFPGAPTEAAARKNADTLKRVLTKVENYGVLSNLKDEKPIDVNEINMLPNGNFIFQHDAVQDKIFCYVCDDDRKFLARSAPGISIETVADAGAFLTLIKETLFNESCDSAGFHIVEHILLRPRVAHCVGDDEPALKVKDCCKSTEHGYAADPYSFWITVAAPQNWRRLRGEYPFVSGSFQPNANHRFFERLVREHTPAHIGVRVCWLDNDQLYRFERAYGTWLTELNAPHTDSCDLDKSTEKLVAILNELDCPCCQEVVETPLDCGDNVQPTQDTPPSETTGGKRTATPSKKRKS